VISLIDSIWKARRRGPRENSTVARSRLSRKFIFVNESIAKSFGDSIFH